MAEGDSLDSPWSHLFSPGVLLLLIGLLGYIIGEEPLESVRPQTSPYDVPEPPSPGPIRSIHGRLWDDPLATSYHDWKQQREILAGQKPNVDPDEIARRAQQARQVLRSVLLDAHESNKKVLLLPVLVPGGPYEDDVEQRLRMRYAVISALAECGYKLSYSQRMSYTVVPVEIDQMTLRQHLRWQLVVPIKLYSRSDESPDGERGEYDYVFLLWINELQLEDRPLAVLGQVVEQLFGTAGNDGRSCLLDFLGVPIGAPQTTPDLRILGPTGSDVLFDIATESKEWEHWRRLSLQGEEQSSLYRSVVSGRYFEKYKTRVYSPRATISPTEDDAYSQLTKRPNSQTGIQTVIRTIGTDAMLVRTLVKELELRGKQIRAETADDVPLVLVTEVDTRYGEAFARAFQAELYGNIRAALRPQIKTFKYEQGIDGKTPGAASEPSGNESDHQVGSETPPSPSAAPAGERSNGRSQFDYLRRVEEELIALDSGLRRDRKQGIQAIGVLGTDVYDKLLILRALRKRFPSVCFFTTDLDTELFEKSESHTARNVVVASHYGLTLNAELQGEASPPPFRDSYQTSLYLATLLALGHKTTTETLECHDALYDPWGIGEWGRSRRDPGDERSKSRLAPLIFEIGRKRPYQLTVTGPDNADTLVAAVHPRSPRERPWLTLGRFSLLLLAAIAVLACLVAFVSGARTAIAGGVMLVRDRWRGNRLDKLVAIVVLFGVLLFVFGPVLLIRLNHTAVDGEPFAWDEGISLWPTTYIYYLVALGVVFFGWRCQKDLAHNEERLNKKYVGETQGKPPAFWKAIRDGFLSVVPGSTSRKSFEPTERARQRAQKSQASTQSYLWAWAESTQGADQGKQMRRKAADLFREYRQHNSFAFQAGRSIGVTIPYLIFAWVLLSRWPEGLPTRPHRGPWSNWASLVILPLAAILTTWLVFCVLGCLQACSKFIRSLKSGEAEWSLGAVQHLLDEWKVRLEEISLLVTVRLIAEHTNAVMKIIYYPFALVLLMLLARSPLFDYLNLPLPLIILSSLLLAALLLSAYSVRSAAHEAREEVLSRMRGMLTTAMADEASSSRVEQLKQLIDEIQREQRGAYGPMARGPIIGSLALFFGGSGGLLLIQRYLPALIF